MGIFETAVDALRPKRYWHVAQQLNPNNYLQVFATTPQAAAKACADSLMPEASSITGGVTVQQIDPEASLTGPEYLYYVALQAQPRKLLWIKRITE